MRDISFGQYYPVESFVHKMDARAKLLLTILYIVMVFFASNYSSYIFLLTLLLLTILLSNIKIRLVLKSVKAILYLVIFTAILNLIFVNSGNVLVSFWKITITDDGIGLAIKMAARLLLLVMGTSILTLTTTPVDLTSAIESLLKPLTLLHFPSHELALIMSIALRFIPILMDEADRIMKAQKARGADFESGGIFNRAKALVPILIPLLISAFKRAEDLSLAMDSRCYSGSKGRTKMKVLKFTYRDLVSALVYLAFFVLILVDKYVFLGLF